MAKKQSVSFVGTILTVEYPTIGKKFVVDTSKYAAVIQACALAHGYKQKFGDAASGKSPAEKYAEVQKIHESLLAGEWERTATPDIEPLVVEAVSRIKKVKPEKITKSLDGLTADDRSAKVKEWASNAKVKAVMAQIRAERAAKAAEQADEEELEIEL